MTGFYAVLACSLEHWRWPLLEIKYGARVLLPVIAWTELGLVNDVGLFKFALVDAWLW